MTSSSLESLPGSSVALVVAAFRYLAAGDRCEATQTLDELPEDHLERALVVAADLTEKLRKFRAAQEARDETVRANVIGTGLTGAEMKRRLGAQG